MNKNELVKALSEKSNLKQKDCNLCVNALLEVLKDSLERGESVLLNGFGKFFVRFKKQRKCVNPQTKALMVVSSKYVPVFSPSGAFKQKFH